MLQAHTLKPKHGSKHRAKVVGRGNASGHGTMSTRGGKGQTARSGGSAGLRTKAFKQMMQSVPKLRGFHTQFVKPSEVYLSDLDKHFASGDIVTLATLKAKNIINNTAKQAKVVQTGELKKNLTIQGLLATPGAAAKIKAAGGELK
ncbi:MAG: 50S ribosomal protein L15 [Candidatus Magasanikbacteria bacterium]|nr:50S ribosomal protein L15 [Candidatus Magasanikbacteria bacterium]